MDEPILKLAKYWLQRQPVQSPDMFERTTDDARLVVEAYEIISMLCEAYTMAIRNNGIESDVLKALIGILEIGKRDMSNPKYDGYFESARIAVKKARGDNGR